jgi:single-strand DNA-binding protein
MASFNRVILIGNLTRDVELRYLQSGMAVADIGLAVSEKRKNANGEWIEDVVFVDVTAWGRTAEVMGEYLYKGSPVFIEGRLKFDTWEGQDGQKRSKLKVTCDRMQLIGAPRQGGQAGPRPPQQGAPRSQGFQQPPNQNSQGQNTQNQSSQFSQAAPPDEFFDAPPSGASGGGDDIPF